MDAKAGLCGCKSWSLIAETTKRVQAFESKCFRHLRGISWWEHKKNDSLQSQLTQLAGSQGPFKRRKLLLLGHVIRYNTLPKTVLQGTVVGGRRGRSESKSWMEQHQRMGQDGHTDAISWDRKQTWLAVAGCIIVAHEKRKRMSNTTVQYDTTMHSVDVQCVFSHVISPQARR